MSGASEYERKINICFIAATLRCCCDRSWRDDESADLQLGFHRMVACLWIPARPPLHICFTLVRFCSLINICHGLVLTLSFRIVTEILVLGGGVGFGTLAGRLP